MAIVSGGFVANISLVGLLPFSSQALINFTGKGDESCLQGFCGIRMRLVWQGLICFMAKQQLFFYLPVVVVMCGQNKDSAGK